MYFSKNVHECNNNLEEHWVQAVSCVGVMVQNLVSEFSLKVVIYSLIHSLLEFITQRQLYNVSVEPKVVRLCPTVVEILRI